MTSHIQRYIAAFDNTTGEAVVTLPVASVTVALRVYLEHPADPPNITTPAIGIIARVGPDITASVPGDYSRTFMLISEASDLPANYAKYIGTIPTPSGVMHIVEVHVVPPPLAAVEVNRSGE